MLVKKAKRYDVECVVRGYLAGSGWKEYQASGSVCGVKLPPGLKLSSKLPEPIFTPATKAQEGHDENIDFDRMASIVGKEVAEKLRATSIAIYNAAAAHVESVGLILADTKFEFGERDGALVWIDEALSPDSSRYWPIDRYREGVAQDSFDKQVIRDYLDSIGWDRNPPPPPALPDEVVEKTARRYEDAFAMITGARARAVSAIAIGRALLSASDKTGLVEFARGLARHGVKIVSTGGTALGTARRGRHGARRLRGDRLSRALRRAREDAPPGDPRRHPLPPRPPPGRGRPPSSTASCRSTSSW